MLLEWTNELISLSINFVELSKTTYVNFTSWFYNNTGYQSKFYLSRYSLINETMPDIIFYGLLFHWKSFISIKIYTSI